MRKSLNDTHGYTKERFSFLSENRCELFFALHRKNCRTKEDTLPRHSPRQHNIILLLPQFNSLFHIVTSLSPRTLTTEAAAITIFSSSTATKASIWRTTNV